MERPQSDGGIGTQHTAAAGYMLTIPSPRPPALGLRFGGGAVGQIDEGLDIIDPDDVSFCRVRASNTSVGTRQGRGVGGGRAAADFRTADLQDRQGFIQFPTSLFRHPDESLAPLRIPSR